jgi:carbonic anhydrase/acetyltransferase-like protein (isoleucine patch superfamily)
MSLNQARTEQPAAEAAASAVLIGQAHLGSGALLAQGVVLRSRAGSVALGNHSAVLENGVLVGWPGAAGRDQAAHGRRPPRHDRRRSGR